MTSDPVTLGILSAAAVELACLPVVMRLWPRNEGIDGDPFRQFDLTRCDRCGKRVLSDAMTYHRPRCMGRPKELRVGSLARRRW